MAKSPYQLPEEIVFPDDQEDMRLDAALKQVFSSLSLREVRRLLARHHIRLNGHKALKGAMISAGDRLELKPHGDIAAAGPDIAQAYAPRATDHSRAPLPDDDLAPNWGQGFAAVHIIKQTDDFVALYKPAGLHSVELKNRGGDSLEELLTETWAEHFEVQPILLNRLDLLTSGIVLAAFTPAAVAQYQTWEDKHSIEKTYYALVEGLASGDMNLCAALDMDSRIKTRVLNQTEPDAGRHTRVKPVRVFTQAETVVLCAELNIAPAPDHLSLLKLNIQRGARHQIRAHLGAAGHPIIGDHLYGDRPGPIMYLHHAQISLPGFTASCTPPWPEIVSCHLAI